MVINELLVKMGFEVEEKPLDLVNEKLEGISHKLSFLAAAEVVKGLYELAERFSGVAENIEMAAVSAGVTSEAFQKLSFAAAQSGVGSEELGAAMAKLSRNLYNAKQGGESAVKAFADVGITQEQLHSFGNSSEALRALADRFQQIHDPIKRQALAMELLGRGSYRLVGMLGKGGKSLDDFGESAEALGAVFKNDEIESLVDLEHTVMGLGQVFKALGASIGAKVAPSITFLIHKFEEFYAANRQIIAVKFDDWIYDITYGIGYFAGVIKDATQVVFSFIGAHPALVKWLGFAAMALGALSIATELSLGTIGFLVKGLHNVVGVLKLLPMGFSALSTVASASLSVVASGLALFQGVLGQIAFRLGVMLAGVFPGVSAFFISLNSMLLASPVGLFAAGLLSVVLAGQALWTLLRGGSFKDTWIGMLFEKVLALPSAIMKVYRYLKGEKGPEDGVVASTPVDASSAANINASAVDIPGLQAQMSGLLSNAGRGIGTAAAMAGANIPVAAPILDFSGDSQGKQGGYTLNAPVTINTADGLSPTQAYKAVKEAASDHFDRQVRDLMRSQQTAVVH